MRVILILLLSSTLVFAQSEIPEDIMRDAEETFKQIQKNIYPEVDKIIQTVNFDNDTGTIRFEPKPIDNITAISDVAFKAEDRLYIFISKSIPKDILDKYAKDIDSLKIGRNAIFVIRGCIDGCSDFRPTYDFLRSFIMKSDTEIKNVQVWIDPLLFRKYNINEVPSFVYAKNVKPLGDIGSEGVDSNLKDKPTFTKSAGDWSLEYHLKELGFK